MILLHDVTFGPVWINPERITGIYASFVFGKPCTKLKLETSHPELRTIHVEGEPQTIVDRLSGAGS